MEKVRRKEKEGKMPLNKCLRSIQPAIFTEWWCFPSRSNVPLSDGIPPWAVIKCQMSRLWTGPRQRRWSNVPTSRAGFTLLETLVAITVIIFAMVGPLTLAAKSLAQAQYARDQITAFYLAQEGLEIIRWHRDTKPGAAWRTGAGINGVKDCLNTSGCDVDVRFLSTVPCTIPCEKLTISTVSPPSGAPSGSGDAILFVPGSSGSSDPDSKFTRTITIVAETPNTNEWRVKAVVSWPMGVSGDREVVLEESIFDR